MGVVKRNPPQRVGGAVPESSLCSMLEVGLITLCPVGMSKFIWSLLLQRLSFVDVATGWLGQGLGAACGMAYTGKYFDKAR